jgi:hypothetical protein
MIRHYEAGFADRVIAKEISGVITNAPRLGSIIPSIIAHAEPIRRILDRYPKYFETVLNGLE